ncbi:hypothetical protein ACVW0J_000698 [Bradyrhizobium sp. i1.7.7]
MSVVLVKALRGLDGDGLDLVERHGIAVVVADVESGFDPALARFDQGNRDTILAVRQHRKVLRRLGKGHAAGAAGERAVGIEGNAILRRGRQHRHLTFR